MILLPKNKKRNGGISCATINHLSKQFIRKEDFMNEIFEKNEEKKRLFTLSEAAEYLGVSKQFLAVHYRKALPPKKLGARFLRYDKKDLDGYIDNLQRC